MDTAAWIVLTLSAAGTIYVWTLLSKSEEHWLLRLFLAGFAVVPIFGPLLCVWIVGLPPRLPSHLRATMNHYGRGGRIIGFGSGRLIHPNAEEANDWSPTVP